MCGRLSLTDVTPEILTAIFSLDQVPEGVDAPGTDVRPTDTVLAVTSERPRTISALRWGLVPYWARDQKIGSKMFNARAETLAERPAFREAYRARRCLVVVDGWYEWQDVGAPRKQPWKFSRLDGAPFGFAGLWETWADPDGAPLRSCTIITTAANPALAPFHDRMPVVIPREAHDLWLDPVAFDVPAFAPLLMTRPTPEIRAEKIDAVR
jgi:putative SOS response-associated peptidase YedK